MAGQMQLADPLPTCRFGRCRPVYNVAFSLSRLVMFWVMYIESGSTSNRIVSMIWIEAVLVDGD